MKMDKLSHDHPLYRYQLEKGICYLTFKGKPIAQVTDLSEKETFLNMFRAISIRDDIKVVVIKSSPDRLEREEYLALVRSTLSSEEGRMLFSRMRNAVNQILVELLKLNKLLIHLYSGNTVLPYMAFGMACDYRIAADDTVIQNTCLELGAVPVGGLTWFLSHRLGRVAADRLLLSGRDLSAKEAEAIGLFDQVVSSANLDQCVRVTAEDFAQNSYDYRLAIKKLMSHDLNSLHDYLQYETSLATKLSCR